MRYFKKHERSRGPQNVEMPKVAREPNSPGAVACAATCASGRHVGRKGCGGGGKEGGGQGSAGTVLVSALLLLGGPRGRKAATQAEQAAAGAQPHTHPSPPAPPPAPPPAASPSPSLRRLWT